MSDNINVTADISQLNYEQAYELLEQTVNRMSEAAVPLEELMRLYENGVKLGEHCERLLAGYEAKMEMVSRSSIEKELDQLKDALPAAGEEEE